MGVYRSNQHSGVTLRRTQSGRSEQGHPFRHNAAGRGGGFRVTKRVEGGREVALERWRQAVEGAAHEATRVQRAHRATDPENRPEVSPPSASRIATSDPTLTRLWDIKWNTALGIQY